MSANAPQAGTPAAPTNAPAPPVSRRRDMMRGFVSVEPGPRAHQKPRVSASRRLRSRSGRDDVTYGTLSKFQSGGGDVVYHSSVSPSHGSFPARGPVRDVLTMLAANTSMPTAITYDPIVEAML